ncbi:MAG: ribosome small subunit-dependent GTPase A [Candidatus Eisenbacteria bacterium]|uniref:Small ribosomal subunit biogenesis GTPase RsgA n=1 Tax=Eiseniibacteriota bacterium TaxID=2212470 RepID=A0A7Y2H1J0_UNCEI|nr:ribosome small subunit-dependent GTPase A [Candidatus Eisenbacteria bacterium]
MDKAFRVVRVQSGKFSVSMNGEEKLVLVPKKLRYQSPEFVDPVSVGDWVHLDLDSDTPVITSVLPRTNALSRPASGRANKRQVVATNIDLAIVVLAAVTPKWKPTTLDRYLLLAEAAGIKQMLCLNKIDLDPTVVSNPMLEPYRNMGLPIVFTSNETGEGLSELVEAAAGKTCVFFGSSGVGKSSLINTIIPGADLRVGEVSDRTQKGMHTTTWVELRPFGKGGSLIDSPGLRVLDLSGIHVPDLPEFFPDFLPYLGGCHFDDCGHASEPKCTVRDALAEGKINTGRYESYIRIRESLLAGTG